MSKIEWTNRTWNPTTGCSKVSPGCNECYAIKQAHRLAHMPHTREKYAGTTVRTKGGRLNWTGHLNMAEAELKKPLGWKKPAMIFVNSMSDLFHETVPFGFVDQVFAAMALCPQHTFQILTKRPERAVAYFNYKDTTWANEGMRGDERIRYQCWHSFGGKIKYKDWKWPLPNVWIGTSVENQTYANERIPQLLQVPAAVRFLSCEPLLGPLDLTMVGAGIGGDWAHLGTINALRGYERGFHGTDKCPKIDWVIAGGESGHHATPMHPDWVRSLRDQCAAAGVPFFFKQWGEWMPLVDASDEQYANKTASIEISQGHVNQYTMIKVGKKASGNHLDERQHLDFPKSAIK